MVRIAAASDLKYALENIRRKFLDQEPDTKIEVVFGASGALYTQLTQDAPFDVFLSADRSLIDKLVEAKLAIGETQFVYARGHVVLWGLRSRALKIADRGMEVLRDPQIQKIAIANPAHAPYGRAAEAALRHWGIYDDVQDRLVLGENVAQTLQFVDSGSADVGMIALSLALAPSLRDKGDYWQVPEDAYPPLDQAGVILRLAANKAGAQKFREFLKSGEGQAILQQYGFSAPET